MSNPIQRPVQSAGTREPTMPGKFAAALSITLLTIIPGGTPAWAQAGHAHQHGNAQLQVSVEGHALRLEQISPLENLVGFERRPRNEKEMALVQAMAKQLRSAGAAFVPTRDAGCKATAVQLESTILDKALLSGESVTSPAGKSATGKGETTKAAVDQHAELTATYLYTCTQAEKLREIQVNLFDSFKRLRRIEAKVAGVKRQSAANLTPASRGLALW